MVFHLSFYAFIYCKNRAKMPHCVLAGILQMLPEHGKITSVKDFFTPQYFPHKTAKRFFYMAKNFSSHHKITPLFSPESELFLKKSENFFS